ncbi:hypothetical protein HFP72_11285 [Nocardiopsis sp. ARC36]
MNHNQFHPSSTSLEGETYPLEVLVDTAADIAAEFTMNRMSRADAEDAAAHAIDEARRSLAAGKAIDHPRRWMHRVATRFHSKQVRKRERDVLTDDVDRSGVHVAAPGTAPEEVLEIKEGTRLALDLLARLPVAQREAMVLHVLHGLERPEVARLLGISPRRSRSGWSAPAPPCPPWVSVESPQRSPCTRTSRSTMRATAARPFGKEP